MKRFLVFLVMALSLSMFGVVGVMAVDQYINATINENITISITPATVEFGAVVPGTNSNAATSGDITFDPTGSNVDVNVEVTTVSGEPFHSGLKFDMVLAEGEDYDIPCIISGDVCTYTPEVVTPTLDVPVGSPAGGQSGTITYTITGTAP